MSVYLPNLLYTTIDCTFCYRLAENVCICSLAFCSVHGKLHMYGDHKTAILIKNESLFYDDCYKNTFKDQNTGNSLIEERLLKNLLDQKSKLPICKHVKEFEQQLTAFCAENKNNLGSFQIGPEKHELSCCKCPSKDPLICLSCLSPFCPRELVLSDAKAHMKEHFCKMNKVEVKETQEKSETSEIQAEQEIIDNYPHYFHEQHDLAIRDQKIFCYSCDRQVFSPLLHLTFSEDENDLFLESNNYVQNLKQLVKKLNEQNSELYNEQNNLIKMSNVQEKLLFGYDGNGQLYHILSQQEDNLSTNLKDFQPDAHFVRGIVNEGNTCYLNTALQLLADIIGEYDQDQHLREQHGLSETQNTRKEENFDIQMINDNFYQQDPLFCLTCQLFKVLTSLRPSELTLSETIDKIDNTPEDKNVSFPDDSEKKSPSIYDLNETKNISKNYTSRTKTLPAISITPLLHLLSADGAIKLGMQQDSAEILGWLLEKISTACGNQAKDEVGNVIKNGDPKDNDCMSKSLENILSIVYTYKECETCKTRLMFKEEKMFLALSDLNSSTATQPCETCGNDTKISVFFDLSEYLLIYNKYDMVYGDIVMQDVQKAIFVNSQADTQEENSEICTQSASENVSKPDDLMTSECFLTLQAMGYPEGQILQVLEITQDLNLALDILSQGQPTNENSAKNDQFDKNKPTSSFSSTNNVKYEEMVDFEVDLHDLHPQTRLEFLSGIKYGNVGSVLGIVGHYVYHKSDQKNLIIDDDKIRLAVDDEMLYKGHMLMVYRVMK